MEHDIRWVQRLQNFQKALKGLNTALSIVSPDEIQRAGMIQFFEMTFELSWNLLKDYLEEQGFTEVSSPRAALKMGFSQGLVADGHSWMKLLEDRNLTSHTYNEEVALEVEGVVRLKYHRLFLDLVEAFQEKIP